MKLTYEDTSMFETPKGGFKRASLEAVGVPWPPEKGWRSKLVGKEVDEADFLRAIEISEAPTTKKNKKRERRLKSEGQTQLFS